MLVLLCGREYNAGQKRSKTKKQKNEGAKMNPDENKNDNQVVGVSPQVPGVESPSQTPTVETPQSTGVTGFDATGDAPGDSFTSPSATSPSGPSAAPEPPTTVSDPSVGLPGGMAPSAPSGPVVAPTMQTPDIDTPAVAVESAPIEQPKAEHSNTLVIVLVVLVVLLAAATAAYFAGLFG